MASQKITPRGNKSIVVKAASAQLMATKRPTQQKGAALIIAMLIVTVVVMLTVTLSSDFTVLFKRVENQLHSQQALAYMLGAEGLGRQVLLQDSQSDSAFDHRNEQWLERDIPYATEQAQIVGRLVDLQGRFALNSLQKKPPAGKKYSIEQQHFIRLLQTLPLESPLDVVEAEQLTNAAIDWIDRAKNNDIEEERSPGGAEDLYYGDAIPAGRAANREMASKSELRWVKGFTEQIYLALAPHVTVWGTTGININTASENLLRSFGADGNLEPLETVQIQAIVDGQAESQAGFKTANDAFSAAGLSADIDKSLAVVSSDYFLLITKTLLGRREYQLQSVLKRGTNEISVVARSQTHL